jgi:hypothetical protein
MQAVRKTRGRAGLSQNLAALARIGESLERRWAARRHRFPYFHDIASECLSEATFHRQFDEEEILTWVNRVASLPKQFDPVSSFGQPPLTVWRTDRFVLDLYFWVDTETSIHDHSFSGAFTNLSGNSLNCTYQFEQAVQADEGVRLGSLLLDRTDYLMPGDVCPIAAGAQFIHRVWHLDCPTITLVARTITRPRGLRLYSYHPEGIAVRSRRKQPIEFQRRREFLWYLFRRRHPRRMELAEEVLARSRGWRLFMLLRDLVMICMNDSEAALDLDGLIERLPARCHPWINTGLAVIRAEHPLKSVFWRRLGRTEHRLLIALLSTQLEIESVGEWLARHGYGDDGHAMLTDWLSEMDADQALHLSLGSARTEIIGHLLRGLSDAEALQEMRRTYAISAPEAELLLQGFNRFRKLSFLKPFLESGRSVGAVSAASKAAFA